MFFEPGFLVRLPLYIVVGLVNEFLFTALADLIDPHFLKSWNVKGGKPSARQPDWCVPGRDPRGLGYSFLWMLPIYALLGFVELGFKLMQDWPIYTRGVVYVLVLWCVEYLTGALIKKISGFCPWDYSASRYNLHGYVRLDFFPLWFVFTLQIEWWSGKFIALTPALQKIF